MKAYFAHPISDYDTESEQQAVEFLETQGFKVENPNQAHHQEGYARLQMTYFTDEVLPSCSGCVYMTFPGGITGAGVAMEVEYFLSRGLPVQRLELCAPPWGEYTRLIPMGPVSVEEWRGMEMILTRDETRGASRVLKSIGGGR